MVRLKDMEFNIDLGKGDYYKVSNGKFSFCLRGEKHIIGSKLYPVTAKDKASGFANGVTEGFHHLGIAEMINKSNWEFKSGYCYTNAEVLCKVFNEMGIDAKYYSGWVFTGLSMPIHHAWVVVDGNVYDISIHMTSQYLMMEQANQGLDLRSKEAVRAVKESMSKTKPIQDHFVWGKVPDHMFYVGNEDTPESARKNYAKAINASGDVSNHPSYNHMSKGDMYEPSPYQKALNEA